MTIAMHKLAFILITFRQPMRTLLLMALAAAASFAFVANVVEYIAMSGSAERISGYYRSIGYLSATGDGGAGSGSVGGGAAGSGSASANVYAGAEIVASSRYVDFEDRRRGVDAVLQGMKNADTRGMRGMDGYSTVLESQLRHTDAFFYGTLSEKETGALTIIVAPSVQDTYITDKQPYIKLVFRIDSVLEGYPELAAVGQNVVVYYFLSESELDEYNKTGESATEDADRFPATQIDDMEIGSRYFVRGAYYRLFGYNEVFSGEISLSVPVQGSAKDALIMRPLNELVAHEDGTRSLNAVPVWFVPVAPKEVVDGTYPGLGDMGDTLFQLAYNQSAVQLRTTEDISLMPYMQDAAMQMKLIAGRGIDREDNKNANPVAVVSKFFADTRGIGIGDKLTIGISDQQIITGIYLQLAEAYFSDITLTSAPKAILDHEIELEVIGIYIFVKVDLPQSDGFGDSYPFNKLYVPDSVLPGGYEARPAAYLPDGFGYPEDGSEYLPAVWYSFVLRDARDEDAFLRENEERLAALGYAVRFLPTNAAAFWESAAPILRGAAFNAVVFSAALVAVLALVAFLFLRQRRKDYAIARALGSAAKPTSRQLLSAVSLVGLPAVAIGSVAAWFFALGRANAALEPLGEVAGLDNIAQLPLLPLWWLPVLAAAAFAVLLGLSAIGAAAMSRKRMQDML